MTKHTAQIFVLGALLASGLAAGARAQPLGDARPASVGMSAERLERLDAALEGYVERGELAGTVTLVARRGRIVFHEANGYRDLEDGAPMQTSSMFRIASQTKAIVSVAAMMLQEEGRLLIGDPVGDYLPEFMHTTVAEPDGEGGYTVVDAERPVTIRDLLTHTSGFSYGTGPGEEQWQEAGIQGWYFADRDEPIRETVERMAELPASAQPGERWIYGYNTDILGALVEQVSGEPLDEFLDERIFTPLGMDDTHFYVPEAKRDRVAAVYGLDDGELARAPERGGSTGQGAYIDGPRESFSGGAGLVSTASDYARFLQMLLNGGELDGERLLGPKTVELMTVDHLGDIDFGPGQGFGRGFSIVEDLGARGEPGSVGEFGWGGAYHSTYWVDPAEELVVVHLAQLIPAVGVDDQDKVRALVYQAVVE